MFILFFFLLLFHSTSPILAFHQSKTRPKSVSISVHLGQSSVTIFGYTSPSSRVELKNSRIFDLTYSNKLGYFEFKNTILPTKPSELCLSTIDQDHRQSPPVCIPPPPALHQHSNIGPIIIAPTLTINSPKLSPHQTVIASGQSIPNTPINIFFFQKDNHAPLFPKSVHAFSLPKLSSATDSTGNFSFNLPTSHSTDYRLYVASSISQLGPSPKSNTLAFSLPSLFFIYWQEYSLLIILLPLFILTLAIFIYLIYQQKQTPQSLIILPNEKPL
ncbi:hypothetical protein DRH14_00225 [Candidatus Shapirobacteria bacterium]|nr:MAG: hypothetical protein DRH14_00225 [Candidatus Shapirobacteria bacterium]